MEDWQLIPSNRQLRLGAICVTTTNAKWIETKSWGKYCTCSAAAVGCGHFSTISVLLHPNLYLRFSSWNHIYDDLTWFPVPKTPGESRHEESGIVSDCFNSFCLVPFGFSSSWTESEQIGPEKEFLYKSTVIWYKLEHVIHIRKRSRMIQDRRGYELTQPLLVRGDNLEI